MKVIDDNKHKIHSNILHNSVDHIIKSQIGTDASLGWHPYIDSAWELDVNKWSTHSVWIGLFDILTPNKNIRNFYEFKHNLPLSESNNLGFASRCEGRKNPHYLDGLRSFIFTNSVEFNLIWKNGAKIDTSKSKIYHYDSSFKDMFYNMDWGVSHSSFTSEPFGYSIFEAVDRGKLPILNINWCKDLEYPYRASSKKEFNDIYSRIIKTPFEEKNKWFAHLKTYMIEKYTDKNKWIDSLLDIYNK